METLSNPLAASTPKTKKNQYVDTDSFLAACETALLNAADPEIAPLLAQRSFTAGVITAKQTELANLRTLVANQKKEYGDQYATTKAYADAVALLHPEYMDHLALARVVLKNNTAAQTALV